MTVHTKRPAVMPVKLENIPSELKVIPQWLVWKWVKKTRPDGSVKYDKPPLCVDGSPGSSTDPTKWVSFNEAVAALPNFDGLGFAMGEQGSGLVGVDLDDCRDLKTGFLTAEAEKIIESLDTYFEISPSFTGAKGWFVGDFDKTKWRSKIGNIEVYRDGRYMTVTGHTINNKPIADIDLPFYDFLSKYMSKPTEPPKNSAPVEASDEQDRIRHALAACMRVEVAESEGDGSKRLVKYSRQCLRAGLSPEGSILVVRAIEKIYPFPKTWTDDQIRTRYESAKTQSEVGEAINVEKIKASKEDPRVIARGLIADGIVDGVSTVIFDGSTMFKWEGSRGCWAALTDQDLRTLVANEMDRRYTHILSAHVSSVIEHMRAIQSVNVASPSWIGDGQKWDLTECFMTKDAIVNLKNFVAGEQPVSIQSTPKCFSTTAAGYLFRPNDPGCPVWNDFLSQVFADEGSRLALQMWFGYCLTADLSQQKILFLIGPKRSGKGVIAQVLTELIGSANVCGPTLAGLATNFGLASLVGKSLGIIGDARLGRSADQAVITERLLSISAGDLLTIDRKYAEPISTRLPTRLVVLSNELPRLTDASNALASRMLIVRTAKSFYGSEDTKLTEKLLAELPGILHWAVEGWSRLRDSGKFVQPDSGKSDVEQLRQLSSPLTAFIEDRCELSGEVGSKELFRAWGAWCTESNYPQGSVGTFGRDLAAIDGIFKFRKSEAPRPWVYRGISLLPEYRETAFADAELFEALS